MRDVGRPSPAREARPDPGKGRDSNMAKKQKREEPVTELEPVVAPEPTLAELADDAEIEEQIALPNSVVKREYKVKYRDRARANGLTSKAAKRSAWDWLAQELAAATLTKENKLRVDDFVALLEANGIAEPLKRWPNQSKGWEGRLRMTGRLALQRVVAERGELFFADGDSKPAPEDWVARFLR